MSAEIIEGNKLIAEFMGLKIGGGLGKLTAIKNGQYCNPKYHSSWDWLMPVYHKILYDICGNGFELKTEENVDHFLEIKKRMKLLQLCLSNIYQDKENHIKTVWLTIVEFIKWYQNQILNNILIKVNHG